MTTPEREDGMPREAIPGAPMMRDATKCADAPRAPAALPEVATVEQVARHLQVDPKTVRKLLAAGKLRGAIVGRHWRIPRGAVGALLGEAPTAEPFVLPDRVARLGRAGRPRTRRVPFV